LQSAFPDRSPTSLSIPLCTPRNPVQPKPYGLGFSPFARRYLGNHYCFLFLRVLRCFSSPGVPLYTYEFSVQYYSITSSGFPHSETSGSQPAYGSPKHIGVCPVLHRHLAPRHPPCALRSLTYVMLRKFAFRCLESQSCCYPVIKEQESFKLSGLRQGVDPSRLNECEIDELETSWSCLVLLKDKSLERR